MSQEQNRREQVALFAQFLSKIRLFMSEHDILEIFTDPLMQKVVPDRGVDPLKVSLGIGLRYLHTSPEWEMKKALASGSGSIYQMGHVFRDDLDENWHKPAFLMLEWYEVAVDDTVLINRCLALLMALGVVESASIYTVFELYQRYCGIDLQHCKISTLQEYTKEAGIYSDGLIDPDHMSSWLELIWVNQIEPNLEGLVVVKNFPVCQSALARIEEKPFLHAKRFEIFLNGCELANGYDEATDEVELKQRFHEYSGPHQAVDASDISTLPACSGVSFGVERLYCMVHNRKSLERQ